MAGGRAGACNLTPIQMFSLPEGRWEALCARGWHTRSPSPPPRPVSSAQRAHWLLDDGRRLATARCGGAHCAARPPTRRRTPGGEPAAREGVQGARGSAAGAGRRGGGGGGRGWRRRATVGAAHRPGAGGCRVRAHAVRGRARACTLGFAASAAPRTRAPPSLPLTLAALPPCAPPPTPSWNTSQPPCCRGTCARGGRAWCSWAAAPATSIIIPRWGVVCVGRGRAGGWASGLVGTHGRMRCCGCPDGWLDVCGGGQRVPKTTGPAL